MDEQSTAMEPMQEPLGEGGAAEWGTEVAPQEDAATQAGASRPAAQPAAGEGAHERPVGTTPADPMGQPDHGAGATPVPGVSESEPDPRRAEIRQFVAHFPGVKGEDIPAGVWEMVRGGLPLTAAYALHQCRALRLELETMRNNERARARSTGSMSGLGERRSDPLDEGWYDD